MVPSGVTCLGDCGSKRGGGFPTSVMQVLPVQKCTLAPTPLQYQQTSHDALSLGRAWCLVPPGSEQAPGRPELRGHPVVLLGSLCHPNTVACGVLNGGLPKDASTSRSQNLGIEPSKDD